MGLRASNLSAFFLGFLVFLCLDVLLFVASDDFTLKTVLLKLCIRTIKKHERTKLQKEWKSFVFTFQAILWDSRHQHKLKQLFVTFLCFSSSPFLRLMVIHWYSQLKPGLSLCLIVSVGNPGWTRIDWKWISPFPVFSKKMLSGSKSFFSLNYLI